MLSSVAMPQRQLPCRRRIPAVLARTWRQTVPVPLSVRLRFSVSQNLDTYMANPISSSGVINGQIVYAEQVLEISHALNGTGSNSIIILGDVIQGSLDNLTDNTSSFAHGYQTTASGLY